MGANCLNEKDVMIELAQMKRKNAMSCLAEYFTKAPKSVLAKITKDSTLQRSFINSFDSLEPFLLLNSSVITPIFIQMAAMSEDLCNELIQSKILLDYPAFTVKNSQQREVNDGDKDPSQQEKQLEVMLNLLEGLVMAKPEKQVSRLTTVLRYVLKQTAIHAGTKNLQDAKLHLDFVIGVANLFVDCAALIAKELTILKSSEQVDLSVTNADIEQILKVIP